jgi:hypothetical protein
MNNLIIFNGKTYKSVEEMPADIRLAYEQVMGAFSDQDGDGVPEAFEGLASVNVQSAGLQNAVIYYEGKQYRNPDDLPPEARERYEQAMARADSDRNGIPDVLEKGVLAASLSYGLKPAVDVPSGRPRSETTPATDSSTIEPEGIGGGRWLITALILGALLCAGGAAVLLFLRS